LILINTKNQFDLYHLYLLFLQPLIYYCHNTFSTDRQQLVLWKNYKA